MKLPVTVIELIKCELGLLDDADAESIEALIDGNDELQHLAYRIRDILASESFRRVDLSLSPEEFSAYIDGSLDPDQSAKLESKFVESESLLTELISEVCFSASENIEDVSNSLNVRLKELYPTSRQVILQNTNDDSTSSRFVSWQAAVAGCLIVGLIGLLSYIAFGTNSTQNSLTENRQNEDPDQRKNNDESDPSQAKIAENKPNENAVPRWKFDENLQIVMGNRLPDESEVDFANVLKKPVRQKYIPNEGPKDWEGFYPKWDRISGVLFVRDSATKKWLGANSTSSDYDQITTMPSSWGSGQMGELGRLVIDSDSSLEIFRAKSRIDKRIAAQLHHGRFALTEMNPRIQLFVKAGNEVLKIVNGRDVSTVTIDMRHGRAKVLIKSGSVRINGKNYQSGTLLHYSYKEKKYLAKSSRDKARWIENRKPEPTGPLQNEIAEKLLNSNDVIADLRGLRFSENPKKKIAGARMLLSLTPSTDVYETWSTKDRLLQKEAFRWLVSGNFSDPRVRSAWTSISEKIDDRKTVRFILRCIRSAKRKEPIVFEDSQRMVALLEHQEFIVRQSASYFLQSSFGNPFKFDAAASVKSRKRLAAKWNQQIKGAFHASSASQPESDKKNSI